MLSARHVPSGRATEFTLKSTENQKAAWKYVKDQLEEPRQSGYQGRIDAKMDEWGSIKIANGYWDVPMGRLGIYQATYAELLHLFPQGIFKLAKNCLHVLLTIVHSCKNKSNWKASMRRTEELLNYEMAHLPTFRDGVRTIRKFLTGFWTLNWVSGEDHIAMFQQLFFALGYPTTEYREDTTVAFGTLQAQRHVVEFIGLLNNVSWRLHTFSSWSASGLDILEADISSFLKMFHQLNGQWHTALHCLRNF